MLLYDSYQVSVWSFKYTKFIQIYSVETLSKRAPLLIIDFRISYPDDGLEHVNRQIQLKNRFFLMVIQQIVPCETSEDYWEFKDNFRNLSEKATEKITNVISILAMIAF